MKTPQDKLIKYVADLEKMAVITIVQERLSQGYNPFQILEACQEGVRIVGHRFEQGRYYIAGLIMAGEILRIVVEMLQPYLQQPTQNSTLETIVIGTVQGDIHDIGKNLVTFMLDVNGFDVLDLGIDVPPQQFVDAIQTFKPQVVALSGFLTLAYDSMKRTVDAIEATVAQDDVKIMIGGGQINDKIKEYVGAHAYGKDAMSAVRLAQGWIGGA